MPHDTRYLGSVDLIEGHAPLRLSLRKWSARDDTAVTRTTIRSHLCREPNGSRPKSPRSYNRPGVRHGSLLLACARCSRAGYRVTEDQAGFGAVRAHGFDLTET